MIQFDREHESRLVFRAFLQGLKQPSLLSVGTALGTLSALFLGYLLVFGEWFMASSTFRYMMTDTLDTSAYVTHKVLSRQNSEGPAVVILGSSVTLRCVESEQAVSERVLAATGQRLHVHELGSDAQTPWDMAAILEYVQPGEGGVLVLGMTPGILGVTLETLAGDSSLRLGLNSEIVQLEARRHDLDVPVRTGLYALDNAKFIISRRKVFLLNLLKGGVDYSEPLEAPWYEDVNTPEYWAEEVAALEQLKADYRSNSDFHFDLLARTIARLGKEGEFEVVVLESPLNPRWWELEGGAVFYAEYRADLEEFAAKLDAPMLQVSNKAGLAVADFVDMEGHISNEAARRRCTQALSEEIAGVLEHGS